MLDECEFWEMIVIYVVQNLLATPEAKLAKVKLGTLARFGAIVDKFAGTLNFRKEKGG